jgi:large subunit ribosomal protein L3
MKIVLGKKLDMTQKFNDDGTVIPVTTILVEPCFITQIKTKEKDGYRALQIGSGTKKKLSKSLAGHLKDLPQARYLRELRLEEKDETEYKKGQKITAAIFTVGEKVKVAGDSKGKGFQGVVRKYGFAGAPKSHGTKDQLRHPGSIGATGPAHVFKGQKMPGRMGGGRITITNLEIVAIDTEQNLIFIKGAIPGSRNGLVEIIGAGEMKIVEEKEAKKKEPTPKQEVKDEEKKEPKQEATETKTEVKEEKVETKKEPKKEDKAKEEKDK